MAIRVRLVVSEIKLLALSFPADVDSYRQVFSSITLHPAGLSTLACNRGARIETPTQFGCTQRLDRGFLPDELRFESANHPPGFDNFFYNMSPLGP